jgi:ABC-2 type transport system ATP-binding protein
LRSAESSAQGERPQLLLLDEPVAALDPLARREFLTSLTEAVADSALAGSPSAAPGGERQRNGGCR